MFVPYNSMPDTSKVWVYQSDKEFSNSELEKVTHIIENFIHTWKRHGDDLKASFLIKYNRFVVLLVDESYHDISGCSIDASVNLIKEIENEFSLDLTNRLNITFKSGNNINLISLSDFQKYANQEKITAETLVFNNLVNNKKEFETIWETKASNSWHKRFLNQ